MSLCGAPLSGVLHREDAAQFGYHTLITVAQGDTRLCEGFEIKSKLGLLLACRL